MDCLSTKEETTSLVTESNSNNLLINNKSCFLCLQVNSDHNLDFETESLRFISQYLKIPLDYYLEGTTGASADSSVILCSTCVIVHSKLTSLIQQLELTQMFINYQMQIYSDCLKKPTFRSESDEVTTHTRLRTIIATACTEEVNRISAAEPKVFVERVIIEQPVVPEVSDDNLDYSDDLFEPIGQDYSDSDEGKELSEATKPPVYNTSICLNRITTRLWKQLSLPETQAECQPCKRLYKRNHRGLFDVHLANRHTEELFGHQRISNVTHQQFTMICKHALNLQISRAKRVKGGSYSIFCPLCSYKTIDTFKLRAHLVINHYEMIERKIMSLQKQGNIDKLAKVNLPGTRNAFTPSKCENWERLKRDCKKLFSRDHSCNKYKCGLCGHLVHITNPQGHLINEHPETLFKSCTVSNLTAKQFRSFCSHILDEEVHNLKEAKEKSSPHKAYTCHLCDTKLFTRNNVRYHLASKHYKVLEEKLVALMEQDNRFKKSDSEVLVKLEDAATMPAASDKNHMRDMNSEVVDEFI